MKAAYDVNAPKRPVNLSLNSDLVARAHAMTRSLSAEVESLLAGFVEQQQQQREAELKALRRVASTWNAFEERHGSLSDEFSAL